MRVEWKEDLSLYTRANAGSQRRLCYKMQLTWDWPWGPTLGCSVWPCQPARHLPAGTARGRVNQAWLHSVLSLPFWGKNPTVKDGVVGSWPCLKAEVLQAAQSMLPVLLSGALHWQLGTGMGLPIAALGCLLTQAGLPAQPLGLVSAHSLQEPVPVAIASLPCFPRCLPFS